MGWTESQSYSSIPHMNTLLFSQILAKLVADANRSQAISFPRIFAYASLSNPCSFPSQPRLLVNMHISRVRSELMESRKAFLIPSW